MDLTELLAGAVEKIPGAVAISLLGVDGLAVETVTGAKTLPQNGSTPAAQDPQAWGVELADLVLAARRAADAAHWGTLRTISLETEERAFLTRLVTPEYFLLLVVQADGNLGRARFELQRVGAALAESL
jgi:predicted regulator of Ras-like GTPase activity (Roadblock/LC7/MglB family)